MTAAPYMFRPSQMAAEKDGSVHQDLHRWLQQFLGASIMRSTAAKVSAYSASVGEVVLCDPTSGGFTVTMPLAAGNKDRRVTVKNASGSTNTITIAAQGAELIDGSASTTITTARGAVRLMSDGTGWLVL